MKYVKRFFLAVTFLALGGFTWWAGMNYTGYCHAEGRYLSDEEKINSAVQFVFNRYPPTISKTIEKDVNGIMQKSDFWYAPENPIMYKDIKDFIDFNPSCCTLSMRTGEGSAPSFLDRITGYVSTYVIVRYKVRYLENSNEKYQIDRTAVAVRNCGASWSGL
jgi:hypothetical protein